MSWEEMVMKEASPLLEKVDGKTRKRIKKLLQSSQPTEYMGQEFTELGGLIDELRKNYEVLYRQVRGTIYPKSRGDLGEEKDE